MVKKLGGWPVLEKDWNDGEFSWKDSVYKFRKEGFSVDYFIDFSVTTDLKNTTIRIIDVSMEVNYLYHKELIIRTFEIRNSSC